MTESNSGRGRAISGRDAGAAPAVEPSPEAGWPALLDQLAEHDARVLAGGGAERQARQAGQGRLSARQRVETLVDPGTFVDVGRHRRHGHPTLDPRLAAMRPPGDGLVCGFGQLGGQPIGVLAHDATVMHGTVGEAGAARMSRVLEEATARRLPVVTLADSAGARVSEGVYAISGWVDVLRRQVRHRRVAPHYTVINGLCVGAAAYAATLSDFVAMVADQSYMFLTGPKVTATIIGQKVDIDTLGGPKVHTKATGSCHGLVASEAAAREWIAAMLDPVRTPVQAPTDDPNRAVPELRRLVPTRARRAYDMRRVLRAVVDEGSLVETGADYGSSLLTAFARFGGRSVALLASQPKMRGGALDIHSSRKGAHFVDFARVHDLPVLTLVDTPGYLPGVEQEHGGVLAEGARLIQAYAELDVPTISVTLRKSYGGANVLAGASRYRLALPTAECAPMGAEAAASITLGPATGTEADLTARAEFVQRWRAMHGDAWGAAERGFFDAVIAPDDLRSAVCRVLAAVDRRGR